MAAASYYNLEHVESHSIGGSQTTFGSGQPSIDTAPLPQLHGGSTYHELNENSSQQHVPLLNKPPGNQPFETGPPVYQDFPDKPPTSQPHLNRPPVNQRPMMAGLPSQKLDTAAGRSSIRLRQRKLEKWRRLSRVLQFATIIISIFFSLIVFAIMAFMFIKYEVTKDRSQGGISVWPSEIETWPTLMMLLTSLVTLAYYSITLLLFCCNFYTAVRSWKLELAKYGLHIIAWIAVSALFKYAQRPHGNRNNLWGWACSDKATMLQHDTHGLINFGHLCNAQSGAWGISIAEIAAKIAVVIIYYVIYIKIKHEERAHRAVRLDSEIMDQIGNVC